MKKDHFPQHGRWLIRNRISESGLKLYSLTLTPTVVTKERREPYTFALDMRERPVCFAARTTYAMETNRRYTE